MARFVAYRVPGSTTLLLDCQADLLADEISTRFVVPLIPVEEMPVVVRRLNPRFEVAGCSYFMATQLAASVLARELREQAGSLVEHEYTIGTAIDVLLGGV